MERERLTTDVSVIESEVFKYLKPLMNRITSFALVKIKNQLTKGLILDKEDKLYEKKCTCFVKSVWRLPCKHQLVELKKKSGKITVDIVHPRWRIMTEPSNVIGENDERASKYLQDLFTFISNRIDLINL